MKTDLAQSVHHGRASERLGQENHVWVFGVHLGNQPFPKVDRLGVRVVDSKNVYAERDPVFDHSQNFLVDTLAVVVKIHRVNVLVLLRWVLGVGNRTIGAGGEPLRVGLNPRMVGAGLNGQVHSDLNTQLARSLHERGKVFLGAEVWVNGVVTAGGRTNRPR